MTSGAPRPYPPLAPGADDEALLLAVVRALLRAQTQDDVGLVLATAVRDLGGALVPARLLPDDALPLDVSLGLGEPVLVVRDPVSVAGAQLGRLLPTLVEDAREALSRLQRRDPSAPDTSLEAFVAALGRADSAAAHRIVATLLHDGRQPRDVVHEVLGPAMDRVGELWLSGAWPVADEHAATAIVASCVTHLPRPTGSRHVVIASPEGEWHELPAQLFAASVEGARVTALGPAVPASDLARYLQTHRTDLLAVSATLSANLVAAAALVAAAHEAGVPVVCGGGAFGGDSRRAEALGATWLPPGAELPDEAPVLAPRPVPQEALLVDVVDEAVLRQALARCAREPWGQAASTSRLERGLDDLRWLARYAAAAVAVDDPTVLTDLTSWIRELLAAREVPEQVLLDAVRHLADVLAPDAPRCAALLRDAV